MKRHIIFIAISAVLLVTFGWGQDGHTVPAPAIGPELPYTEVLTPPMPVNSVQMPLMFSSDGERSNILSGGIQLGSGYDDNALVTPSNHVSNVSVLVLPSIEIRQNRERWSLDLAYSPGITINQNLGEQNQFAHSLSFSTNYRLSPHVSLQLRDNFAKTNNLFAGLFGNTPGPGPLQQSNSSVITPLADSTSNNSGLGLTYQFSASSLVGMSGNYYFVNYGSLAGTPGTVWIHRFSFGERSQLLCTSFSNRHWLGATYNFQQLMFDPGGRTTIHRVLAFYSLTLGSQMTLSFWAGPQYSTSFVSNVLVLQPTGRMLALPSQWSPAAGAMFDWQGSHTSLHAGYSQQISDGGGLAQAVTIKQVDAEVSRRLATRWTATAGAAYARNNPLHVTFLRIAPLRSFQGTAGINYRLTDNLGMSVLYGRQQQRYEYPCCPVRPPTKIACGSRSLTLLPVLWEGNHARSSRRSIAGKNRLAETLADVVPPALVAGLACLRNLDGGLGCGLVPAGGLPLRNRHSSRATEGARSNT